MNPLLTAVLLFAGLVVALLVGIRLRRLVPEHHLTADSKDAVKLAMGLVATMTALLLGLLVSSAKGTYDTARGEVMQMAAKVAFLDRVLALYGPDAMPTRVELRDAVVQSVRQIWPNEADTPAQLNPDAQAGAAMYLAIQHLSPGDDTQRGLKAQATSVALDLAQLRALLVAQAAPSVSRPMLVVVACWLVLTFVGFGLLTPSNATTAFALLASAFSVAAALFLILELDQPFGGTIRISDAPMVNVVQHLAH